MASYSKVFKASKLYLLDEVKVIDQPIIPFKLHGNEGNEATFQEGDEGLGTHQAQQLIQEAMAEAQAIIEQARENADSIEAATEEKIRQWWDENQKKLESRTKEVETQAFQEGYGKGHQEAETQILIEYKEKINEAQELIDQAYKQKDLIVSEAEPFLLELSTVIAKQIIRQELETQPDKYVELIKQHILRFKEKDFITVCVHPDDYDFVQSQRPHLIAVVNGETEIKIIPDHSVSQKGCIIRTAYGSVDARIDTQIEEIKKVILEARREPESGTIC